MNNLTDIASENQRQWKSINSSIFDCETEREGKTSLLGWIACAAAIVSPFIGIALVGLFMKGN